MRNATSRRLGPYLLGDLIGSGGMGEVYRARDERLQRDVAIKVLPAAFSQDADIDCNGSSRRLAPPPR